MKIRRLLACLALIVMIGASVPLTALASTYATVISQDVLFLRDEPSMNGDIIGRYRRGSKVEVLSTKYRNWVKVKTARGQTGYMYKTYLSIYSTEDTTTSKTSTKNTKLTKTYRYIKSGIGEVNFRKRASTSAPLVDRIPGGAKVTVTYMGSVWSRITYKGKSGWVMTKYLTSK